MSNGLKENQLITFHRICLLDSLLRDLLEFISIQLTRKVPKRNFLKYLRANLTKWSNTPTICGKQSTNCLSVFAHCKEFKGLKRLKR